MKKFTKETLANYNGKNGRPAYIAFNGRVYDVTNNSHWLNGENKGIHAGCDVSLVLTQSPALELAHINQVGIYN